jgi:hypothetical protein
MCLRAMRACHSPVAGQLRRRAHRTQPPSTADLPVQMPSLCPSWSIVEDAGCPWLLAVDAVAGGELGRRATGAGDGYIELHPADH